MHKPFFLFLYSNDNHFRQLPLFQTAGDVEDSEQAGGVFSHGFDAFFKGKTGEIQEIFQANVCKQSASRSGFRSGDFCVPINDGDVVFAELETPIAETCGHHAVCHRDEFIESLDLQ